MDEKNNKKGTTTLGLVCEDGVVLATEKRATKGNMISHKDTKKLFKITDNIGLNIAGLVGDGQVLTRYLSSEVELYELKRNKTISVEAATTLLSNIMMGRRLMPYYVGLVLGGVDSDGTGKVYSIDALGGAISDDYVAEGSGSQFVYGVLEDHYEKDMELDEGVELAVLSLLVSSSRDSASGDGVNVAKITPEEGFERLEEDEVKEIISSVREQKNLPAL
ncbi:MAG: archaeal proteasome endopeptidase complex subunit beta [Candidatus Thermoplasmatota archaeon]|nr:archaeal proteasome endopeptidase complex subunit beta [Candidatus Thermoplasmatota archaeon]MBS3790912.1 archaeal proteasome endopeptidase complex subunit beta [Candidatus Thermoplasmatota archaeon]